MFILCPSRINHLEIFFDFVFKTNQIPPLCLTVEFWPFSDLISAMFAWCLPACYCANCDVGTDIWWSAGLRALAPGCPCPALIVQPAPIQSLAWLLLPWLDHNPPWLPTLRLPACCAARDNLGRQTGGNSNFSTTARSLPVFFCLCLSLSASR